MCELAGWQENIFDLDTIYVVCTKQFESNL